MGVADGKIDSNASPEEIAETIFHQGTSTAPCLTQVSGHGVGMSAIRSFLRAEGGDAEIVLDGPNDRYEDFFSFTLVLKLKKQFIHKEISSRMEPIVSSM